MKHILFMLGMMSTGALNGQNLSLTTIHDFQEKLDDVMELIEIEIVKSKLKEVEMAYQREASELNQARLGIIYHEVALNLTFFYKTQTYAGYAEKSYSLLTALMENEKTTPELKVFISAYQASALSLFSAESKKLKLLGTAFDLFEASIEKYSHLSSWPEFMRGSVAENLPKIFWKKRQYAKHDFAAIIKKYEADPSYAPASIMSFSYWAWANANSNKKNREKALHYLDLAIALDPNYEAGRKRAEELKAKYLGTLE